MRITRFFRAAFSRQSPPNTGRDSRLTPVREETQRRNAPAPRLPPPTDIAGELLRESIYAADAIWADNVGSSIAVPDFEAVRQVALKLTQGPADLPKFQKNARVMSVLRAMPRLSCNQANVIAASLLRQVGALALELRTPDTDGRAPALLRSVATPLLQLLGNELDRLRAQNVQPRLKHLANLVLPLLIEATNTKNRTSIRLLSQQELLPVLKRVANGGEDEVFILDTGRHRAAGLAWMRAEGHVCIAILDSFRDPNDVARELARTSSVPGTAVIPVYLKTQRATECSTYALDAACKICKGRNKDKIKAVWSGSPGVQATVNGALELPLAFHKHAQTRNLLNEVFAGKSPREAAQLASKPVTRYGEGIELHYELKEVSRPARLGRAPDTYSASIEDRLRSMVKKAAAHFASAAT